MPFYDLKCKCGYEFKIKATISEREQKAIKCPKCGSVDLDTIFNSVNIIHSRKSSNTDCPNIDRCGGRCCH